MRAKDAGQKGKTKKDNMKGTERQTKEKIKGTKIKGRKNKKEERKLKNQRRKEEEEEKTKKKTPRETERKEFQDEIARLWCECPSREIFTPCPACKLVF